MSFSVGERGQRDLLWTPLGDPGLEHLRVRFDVGGLQADGVVIRQLPGMLPFRLKYRIKCDTATCARSVLVEIERPGERRVELRSDGSGNWVDDKGVSIPGLAGCIDVDIAATPFTNTLPIRRLGLKEGQNAEIDVVYVTVPGLEVRRARQRYTRLRPVGARDVYLYENCESSFRAELPIDDDGLVIDYQGQWKRCVVEAQP